MPRPKRAVWSIVLFFYSSNAQKCVCDLLFSVPHWVNQKVFPNNIPLAEFREGREGSKRKAKEDRKEREAEGRKEETEGREFPHLFYSLTGGLNVNFSSTCGL